MFNPPPGPPNNGPDTPPARPEVREPVVRAAVGPHMRAGAKLRVAREAMGLSLEFVAAKLTIRTDYVAALEAMNVNLIPGKAYAKAYLRSYVKFLGLPEDEIVGQYEGESARLREDASDQIRNPDSKPNKERPWIWALLLAAVGVVFIGVRALNDTKGEQAVQATTVAPAVGKAAVATPAVVAPEAPREDPWGLQAQVVEIQARTPAWIEVRGPDGTIFLSKTLQAGESYRPDVGAGWTLHAKDGGAFQVKLNGAPVGLLGEPGAPVLGRKVDKIAASAGVG